MAAAYLEQLRRAEAAHPEEAALGGGGPAAGEEVEDVGARQRRLELEQLVVVLQALLHDEAQVAVQQVRLQPAAELRQPLAVVFQPPRVLHVEHGGACTRTPHSGVSSRTTRLGAVSATAPAGRQLASGVLVRNGRR